MTTVRKQRSLAAAVVLSALLAGGLVAYQPEQAAAAPAPQDCEDIAGLDKAPALADDLRPGGDPVTESTLQDGTAIPVVMVHGWTGSSQHTSERTGAFSPAIDLTVDESSDFGGLPTSLIGAIQGVGGVSVYTFDYHDLSSRWVTDDGIGPKLAESLTCLATAYGHPAITVAHSMGGLATREALGLIADDGGLGAPGEYISDVITYGTPNTGSDVARFLVDFQEGLASMEGAPDAETATALHSFMVICGAAVTESMENPSACGSIPTLAASAGSDAVHGLATGSDEITALPPWPEGVNVHAYAGDITASFSVSAWFLDVYESSRASIGDIVVPRRSALVGADSTLVNECAYQVDFDLLGRLGGLGGDVLWPVSGYQSGCFHGNLMRTIQLTDSTTSIVGEIVQEAQGVIASGFPADLVGQWCSRLDPDLECFSVAGLLQEFPGAFLESVTESPDTPGAQRYFICLANDLGDSCSMAATMILEYYPVGVEWNCEEFAAADGWPGCDPDYTEAHDVTQPRLTVIPNHQHNELFVDVEPLYRS